MFFIIFCYNSLKNKMRFLMLHKIQLVLNIDTHPHSFQEKFISAIGTFIGIFLTYTLSMHFLDPKAAVFITASMGASAVLLFVVPHGVLSGPWSVIGAHFISALIGVSVGKLVAAPFLAASLAVSVSVLAMQFLKCVHPSGGATALIAVIGGGSVYRLGFDFAIFPVLVNASIITLSAVLYNYFFYWRRYPPSLSPKVQIPRLEKKVLSAEDIEKAITDLDIYVDVSTQELAQIFEYAQK
jgi:CBS domain-containing membrane protein